MAFIQEISESSENNLCFVVFESWAEAIIDRQASFEEAFDTIFNLDLTHVLAKGHCQNAYNKFTTTVYSRQKSMGLMKLTKNFEKIAILKIGELVSF